MAKPSILVATWGDGRGGALAIVGRHSLCRRATSGMWSTVAGRDTLFSGSAIVNGQRLGPPLGIRSLAANSNGTVLFANVHIGGIPRSIDGGKTWQPTIDINSDVHEVCAHSTDPHIVVAASDVGLCISRDAGATWTIECAGLHATHCTAVAFSGDDIFCRRLNRSLCSPGENLSSADPAGWNHRSRRRWAADVDQRYRRHRLHRDKRLNDCSG